ncbi:MAG: cyclic nucleotide-binding domain-containing protein [Sideroxyarcus sp.]|nr:cyclic nucleotide-binding domain-containing protein [Sideroxyarcus sp.]
MNELDAIQASLASFTKRLDEVSTDRFNELRKCSFFDPIPSDWLRPISDQADIRTFAAGEHITSEGEDMSAFYVILFGTATVYYNKKIVGTIRSGECIGEAMFFANENILRSATVIPDTQVIAAEIKKAGINRLQGESKTYMDKALLLALFKKLQGANRKIEELLR